MLPSGGDSLVLFVKMLPLTTVGVGTVCNDHIWVKYNVIAARLHDGVCARIALLYVVTPRRGETTHKDYCRYGAICYAWHKIRATSGVL